MLELAYWIPASSRYVDADGAPVELPQPEGRRAVTVVERHGERVAALIHDPAQSFSIAPAPLTVTADDQSRQFGQPNPPLTATTSGFVASDTRASAVTGSPSCSTSATASSPGGSYQIACTLGSLAAADYSFSFAPGTLSVTYGQTVSGRR
jgi:hypothetical protein